MPSLNKILSLNDCIQNYILKWLTSSLGSLQSPLKRQKKRNYICSILNPDIRQMLLSKVLGMHLYKLDMTSKCHFIALLADESTRIIDLLNGGAIFIDEVFHLYHTLTVSSLSSLQCLKIKCDIKGKQDEKYVLEVNSAFCNSLSQMNNLRFLTLIGIGDESLMTVIGENCIELEYLDVSCSNFVNDSCVSSLLFRNGHDISDLELSEITFSYNNLRPLCKKLKILGLANTDVTSKGILLALLTLPKLVSFDGYVSENVLSKLLNILQDKQVTLNISHLWEYTISHKNLDLIKKLCPNLHFLSLGANSLSSLHNFNSLRELVIECDLHQFDYDILNALWYCGENLLILRLNESQNCKLDLASLVEAVPKLVEIKAPLCVYEDSDIPPWKNLKKADIVVSSSLCIKLFLCSTPSLMEIKILFSQIPYEETHECFDDDLLCEALNNGGLSMLEHFDLGDCNLSENSIESLLIHCPNLTTLQKLKFWKNLSSEYVKELQKRIVYSNWNLQIIMKDEMLDHLL